MSSTNNKWLFILLISIVSLHYQLIAQNTQIRGFIEAHTFLQDDALNFGFGEQDLFITSEINDDISFLSETVFKFNSESETDFSVSIERVIMKYNYKGNHSFLIGKHHTPINYWNDSYHHGRVFFPTIGRPLLFEAGIIPIHTTGISFEGYNLGKSKFGYQVMLGNGLGSSDLKDNDKYKSLTAAVHIKPVDYLQIRAAIYTDRLSAGAHSHGNQILIEDLKQQLYTATVAYFAPKYELLAEATFASNKPEISENTHAFASYIYAGTRIKEKWVPYIRFDRLSYDTNEIYYTNTDRTAYIAGLRFEINFLAVVKLEFQHEDRDLLGSINTLTAQIAIGF